MLEQLISYYTDGNKAKFAAKLGINAQNISAWITRKTYDAELIYSRCSEVSADWLLSGEGEMLISEQKTKTHTSKQNIEIVNNELLELCKLLVQNYQQRDEVMGRLVKMVGK